MVHFPCFEQVRISEYSKIHIYSGVLVAEEDSSSSDPIILFAEEKSGQEVSIAPL